MLVEVFTYSAIIKSLFDFVRGKGREGHGGAGVIPKEGHVLGNDKKVILWFFEDKVVNIRRLVGLEGFHINTSS